MTLETYKSVPLLLMNAPPAASAEMLNGAKTITYTPKQVIFNPGDKVAYWYLLVSGTVRLQQDTPDGDQLSVQIYNAGDTIGAMDVFACDDVHVHCAAAVTVCTVQRFAAAHLRGVAASYPQVAENLIKDISARVMQMQTDVNNMNAFTPPQRIACGLLRAAAKHKLDISLFALPYSKSLLASWLGMRLETFSRAIKELPLHGVFLREKQVKVTDREKLRLTVCGDCGGRLNCAAYKLFCTH